MDYSNNPKRLLWFRHPSNIEKQMMQSNHLVKFPPNLQTSSTIAHFRQAHSNSSGYFRNRNIQGHVKPPPYRMKEVHVPSTSEFKTESENYNSLKRPDSYNFASIPRLHSSRSDAPNSFDVESIWSEIEDIVFSDENDDVRTLQRSISFRSHAGNSSRSKNHTGSRGIQQNKSMLNTLPKKGILKSSSQSSYSSFTNEMGSDGEATTSNNSQRSSESSSLGSKASKKKVHFEERVITKVFLPFHEYALYNDSVFQDQRELVTIVNDMAIQSEFNSGNSEDDGMVKTNDRQIIHGRQDHTNYRKFGNNTGNLNETKMEKDITVNELWEKSNLFGITNNFKGERCESEISFPNFYRPTKVIEHGFNSYPFSTSTSYLLSQEKIHDLKCGNNTVINDDIDKNCGVKHEECKTAFPYRPVLEFNYGHSSQNTRHGRMESGQWEVGTKKRLRSSTDDKQLFGFSKVKFLESQTLCPEEKTKRILEWLDDVKANGRPKNSSSVSLLVIPRPLVRRGSFVGK